jgi:hypothetical protein
LLGFFIDPNVICTSEDVFEILRALEDVTGPVAASGKDVYGHLDALSRLCLRQRDIGGAGEESTSSISGRRGGERGEDYASTTARTLEALKQLDLVRHAAARKLAQCYTLNL